MLETVQISIAEKNERYSVLAVIQTANEEYARMKRSNLLARIREIDKMDSDDG